MARNEEKHAGRLNRLWLQQLDEERLKKNPLRPGLGSLRTADEVKKWMPSIKKDIDFYLKQSQVGCYPDRKISEFTSKIEGLTKEYKAYLRKYRELEGSSEEVPWTDKPYARKHKLNQDTSKKSNERDEEVDEIATKKFVPLSVPILADEESYKDLYGFDTMKNATVALNATETLDTSCDRGRETSCDHGRESCDHGKESCDHGKESCDHGKESCDHGRETSCDHGRESCDHGKESCDHGRETFEPHRLRQKTLSSSMNDAIEYLRPHSYRQIEGTNAHTVETAYSDIVETTSKAFNDEPLEFNKMKTDGYRFLKGKKDGGISAESCIELERNNDCKCVQSETMETNSTLCESCKNVPNDFTEGKQTHTGISSKDGNVASKVHVCNHGNKNVLGLQYSDSSGDEEEG